MHTLCVAATLLLRFHTTGNPVCHVIFKQEKDTYGRFNRKDP